VVVVAVLAVSTLIRTTSRGAGSPQAAVERYLDGLARNDRRAVRGAVANASSRLVTERLRTFGGVPRSAVTYHLREPVREGASRVVELTFGGRHDEVFVSPTSHGWFVEFPAENHQTCDTEHHEICG
jgi:nitrogen fixation protein FixH